MEKQICEMAELICDNMVHGLCDTTGYICNHNCEYKCRAKDLYNAGYRKQREGKWIKRISAYVCSECEAEISIGGFAEDSDPIDDFGLCFCCNCGAMMKGNDNGNS
jgi:hypothetical protein